jgi:hypothetical protein
MPFPAHTVPQLRALHNLNYTLIYTTSIEHTVLTYHMLQDLVVAVFWEPSSAHACFTDIAFCAKSDSNPLGIPVWKIFSFHFWTSPENPLGRQWTLSPENYTKQGPEANTYLGYSVEHACQNLSLVEHSDRRDQAYLLGKHIGYLSPLGPWPPHFFEAAVNATGVQFVGGMQTEPEAEPPKPTFPTNFLNYGTQPRPVFMKNLASSKMLVGLGDPLM